MTLRDTIEDAVNTAESTGTPVVAPAVEAAVEKPIVQAETEEQKAGRTAGRPRDEHGRLLPGKPDKLSADVAPQRAIQSPPARSQAAPSAVAASIPPPPSSWKKDHWSSWDNIATENPQLAEYLNQREGEFAKGVSTYKQEYDSVRPLVDAIQPFLPTLQQHNIKPEMWITNLGNAHNQLALGSPQQKLQMFQKLAQDYQVPLQALYDPQAQQQFLMQQQLQPTPQPDVKALVQEQLTEVFAKQDLQQFQASKDGSGNPLYPHYETVRNTMAQLLEAGAAQDLKSAYDKAIRLHDDIWEAEQAAKQAATLKATQEAQTKQVVKAKAAAVSPKTATPGAGTAQTTKGIRSAIESAVEAHAEGGRV